MKSSLQPTSLNIKEREFLAEDTLIDIIPSFRSDFFHLLSGDYGPFRPPTKSTVPLWLAIMLRKSHQCTIVPPSWLDVDSLEHYIHLEETIKDEFSSLPYYWIEITQLLMSCAAEDIPKSELVRYKLQKLKELRHNKILSGLSQVDARPMGLPDIGCEELQSIKPFFLELTNTLNDYHTNLMNAQIRQGAD